MGARALAVSVFLGVTGVAGAGPAKAAPAPMTIGFIYVGPKTDYGYNQAHAEGAAVIAKLPGVKIREEEMVPETSAVQKTMESMINLDAATVLFPTSFGYFDPHILKEAGKNKGVTFLHCGGMYQEGKTPTNVGSYFGYIDEAQYVAGVVAGLTTKTNKLGFIAAKPIPQVLRNINSYTLGARSVNPKATTTVIFTGDWSMPVKEAEAANSLIDQGVDVLTMHVDSPKVDRRDRRAARHLRHRLPRQPVGARAQGLPDRRRVELGQGLHRLRHDAADREGLPAPPARWPQGGVREDLAVRQGRLGGDQEEGRRGQGQVHGRHDGHLQGPLKDNTGKVVIAAGAEEKQTDINLEKMDYLVDGVVGKTH